MACQKARSKRRGRVQRRSTNEARAQQLNTCAESSKSRETHHNPSAICDARQGLVVLWTTIGQTGASGVGDESNVNFPFLLRTVRSRVTCQFQVRAPFGWRCEKRRLDSSPLTPSVWGQGRSG